jgi:hypothetical protein
VHKKSYLQFTNKGGQWKGGENTLLSGQGWLRRRMEVIVTDGKEVAGVVGTHCVDERDVDEQGGKVWSAQLQ